MERNRAGGVRVIPRRAPPGIESDETMPQTKARKTGLSSMDELLVAGMGAV